MLRISSRCMSLRLGLYVLGLQVYGFRLSTPKGFAMFHGLDVQGLSRGLLTPGVF